MTEQEIKLLITVMSGRLSRENFYRQFPVDIRKSKGYVISEVRNAMAKGDTEQLERAIFLIWLSGVDKDFVDILNELVINPNHRSHQVVAMAIQDVKSPSSVPFIKKALQSNFDYLQYTCSESGAIAKWFSWALYSIGTKEAIDLLKEYAKSEDDGIRKEMNYRLSKIKM